MKKIKKYQDDSKHPFADDFLVRGDRVDFVARKKNKYLTAGKRYVATFMGWTFTRGENNYWQARLQIEDDIFLEVGNNSRKYNLRIEAGLFDLPKKQGGCVIIKKGTPKRKVNAALTGAK